MNSPLGKPLELSEMKAAARAAMECTKTIRQWLPVVGRETLSTAATMDRWHEIAWQAFDRFRAYHRTPGSYYTVGPLGAAELWREMADGMTAVRDHYQWGEVDGINRRPHTDARSGRPPLEIDAMTIDRIDQAALALLAIPEWTESQILETACERWNSGSAWSEITPFVDRVWFYDSAEDRQKQIDACTNRVKRFAKANGIKLVSRQAGRKPGKQGGK